MVGWALNEHIIPDVVSEDLYGVSHLGTITIDYTLVIALVEW